MRNRSSTGSSALIILLPGAATLDVRQLGARRLRLFMMAMVVLLLCNSSMWDDVGVRVVEAAELRLSFDNIYSDELSVQLDCKRTPLVNSTGIRSSTSSTSTSPAPSPAAAAAAADIDHRTQYQYIDQPAAAPPAPAASTTPYIVIDDDHHVFEFHDDGSFTVTLQMEANASKPVPIPAFDYACTANYTVAISALWSDEPVGTPRQVCNAQVNASAYLPLTEAPTLYVFCFMGIANYGPGCLFNYANAFSESGDARADIRPDILFSCTDLYADNY